LALPSSTPPAGGSNSSKLALIGAVAFLVISLAVAAIAITGFDPASLIPTPEAVTPAPTNPAVALTGSDEPTAIASSQPSIASSPRWVIHLQPLTADAPDIGAALADAITAAGQDSSVAARDISIERGPAGAGMSQLADVVSASNGSADGLTVLWENGDSGLIKEYLVDFKRPTLTTVDEPLSAWSISAPGQVPVIVSGSQALPAGLIIGILELWHGDSSRAAARFSALQALPSDVPVEAQDSNQAVILFALGQAEAAQGDPAGALESFSGALRLQNDFPAAALDRASMYQGLGDNTTALSVYQAMQDNPLTQRYALYNLAVAQAGTGDTAGALKTAGDLIAALPESVAALNLRGVIAYQSGDKQAALADFTGAGSLSPDSQPILINQAAAHAALGDYSQALATYQKLITLSPEDASLYLKQGQVFLSSGDAISAAKAFDEAIAKDNQFAAAYIARAQLEFSQGKLNQAITDANLALGIDPNAGAAYRVLGDSWLAQEDFKQAETNYTAALDNGIEDANVYAGRAWARHRQRKIVGAIGDYEQAMALGAHDTTFLLRLGFAYYDGGHEDQSLAMFQQAVDAGLDTAEAHAGLAIALDANLKRSEANAEYQKAIALDKQFADRDFLQSQPLWSSGAIGRAMSIVVRLP